MTGILHGADHLLPLTPVHTPARRKGRRKNEPLSCGGAGRGVKNIRMATTESGVHIRENFGRLRKNLRKVHGGFIGCARGCRAKRASLRVAVKRSGGCWLCESRYAHLCA
jgi:hypothetical protein